MKSKLKVEDKLRMIEMSIYMNKNHFYDHDEEKNKKIIDELSKIKMAIGRKINPEFLRDLNSFYLRHPKYEIGTISKTIQFVKFVLGCYGYNEDEILDFLIKNKYMIISAYSDFRARLAIFNYFGLFDEVFFNKYDLLNQSLFDCYGINTSSLYSIMFGKNINNIETLVDVLSKIQFSEVSELLKDFPLDKEYLRVLDEEMMRKLKVKKSINTFRLKKEDV